MTYSYKSTDKLEVGDHLYTPDFRVCPDYSPFAIWRVDRVKRKCVDLVLLGSKDWVDIPSGRRSRAHTLRIKPEGPEKHGDGKFVRYIGKRPPWALERT